MLTSVERAPAAGINGIEWDAVELPSQVRIIPVSIHTFKPMDPIPPGVQRGLRLNALLTPAQFMENWCYDEKTVYESGLARHFETGEPLPRELFAKLCEQKTYQVRVDALLMLQCTKCTLNAELNCRHQSKLSNR